MAGDHVSPKTLGNLLQKKRGGMGIRAAAGEIGVSPLRYPVLKTAGFLTSIRYGRCAGGWVLTRRVISVRRPNRG